MPDTKIEVTVKAAAPIDSGANIPQGVLARLGQSLQARLDGWFGPGQPLQPQAPPGTGVRALDYPFAVNMNTGRNFAPVPWDMLRLFARNYPLCRVAIEHMKNRISTKPWSIRVVKLKTETAVEHAARAKTVPGVEDIENLIKRPDLQNSWPKWCRKLLGDYLILDAASISIQRKNNGKPYRFMVVDGATIVRKVDEQGMTPMEDGAVAYQQVLKGIPAIDLTAKDLLYAAENIEADRLYGYGRTEQVIQWLVLGLNRLIHQTSYYTEGSVPDTFAFLPEDATPDAMEAWDALFQKFMAGNSAAKRKVWWMPWAGHEPVQMKADDLTDKMDEMLNRYICFSFGVSPSALVSQVNRAAGGQMADDADESGETPIASWLADTMNELIQSPLYLNRPDLEFAFEDKPEVDHLNQAEIDEIYFAMAEQSGNGLDVLNEFRDRDGLAHLDDNTPEPPPIAPPPTPTAPVDPAEETAVDPAPKAPPGEKARKYSEPKNAKGKVLTIEPGKSTPAKAKAQKALAGVLTPFLAEQGALLAKSVGTAYARRKKAAEDRRKDASTLTADEIAAIVDAIMEDVTVDWSSIVPEVSKLLQQGVTSGTAVAGTYLDAEHDIFTQANEWAIEYAEERAAEMVGMKFVDGELVDNPNAEWAITQTTREGIADLIVDALNDGDSIAMLRDSIMQSALFSESRADMVATTETNFANAGGQMEVGKLVGHTHKRSLLSGDHDVDDECDENADAGAVLIDEPFPSGDENSPFHPRCVCLTQTYTPGKEL